MDGCRGRGAGGAEASASSTALGQAARAQDPGGIPASPNVTWDAAPGLPPFARRPATSPLPPAGSIPAPACCSRLQVSSLCFHLDGRP